MKLYSEIDLSDMFRGKVERTGLAVPQTLIVTHPIYGDCLTTFTPVRFIETGKTDQLVALHPKGIFWLQQPVGFLFLSEINA